MFSGERRRDQESRTQLPEVYKNKIKINSKKKPCRDY